MYSLENLPENANNPNIKLTPRSNEALVRTGIKVEDLLAKTAEEVHNKYGGPPIEKSLLEKRIAHEEEKRKHKLAFLKETRKQVIEEEGKGVWSPDQKSKKSRLQMLG